MGRVVKKQTKKKVTSKPATSVTKENVRQAKSPKARSVEAGQEYEYTISGNVLSKWKPLAPSTLHFTQQLVNSSSSLVLSKFHPDDHEDVDKLLDDLKKRVMEALAGVKAPSPVCTDYAKLKRHTEALQEELDANLAQANRMEEEIQRLESNTEERETELAIMKRTLEQSAE